MFDPLEYFEAHKYYTTKLRLANEEVRAIEGTLRRLDKSATDAVRDVETAAAIAEFDIAPNILDMVAQVRVRMMQVKRLREGNGPAAHGGHSLDMFARFGRIPQYVLNRNESKEWTTEDGVKRRVVDEFLITAMMSVMREDSAAKTIPLKDAIWEYSKRMYA